MVPPFGFSVGDFINVIGLINKIRKSLKDVGGAEDDVRIVLQDLQQLELILTQLKDGEWGNGGDVSHVNAVRGVALSGEARLKDFLRKVEFFHFVLSMKHGSAAAAITRGAKKAQWTLSMKEEIFQFKLFLSAKIMSANLLLVMPLR